MNYDLHIFFLYFMFYDIHFRYFVTMAFVSLLAWNNRQMYIIRVIRVAIYTQSGSVCNNKVFFCYR